MGNVRIQSKVYILFSLFVSFFIGRYYSSFVNKDRIWKDVYTNIPYGDVIGMDFSAIYVFGKEFLNSGDPYLGGGNVYPPFFTLFYLPLQLFSEPTAYIIFTIIAYFTLFLVFYIIYRLISDDHQEVEEHQNTILFTFAIIILIALNSHAFKFALERGNSDLFSIFFPLLGLFVLKHKPRLIYLVYFLFSVGAHLKIHPAILMLIPLYHYGLRKSLLPLIVVNSLMLFSLGFTNSIRFIEDVSNIANNPYLWPGNHSAASYYFLNFEQKGRGSLLIKLALYLIPLALWLFSTARLKAFAKKSSSYLLYFCACIPLMCVLPSQSHDYKLVIVFPALFFVIYLLQEKEQELKPLFQKVVMFFFLFLAVWFTRNHEAGFKGWNANKYLSLVIFQVLTTLLIYKLSKTEAKKLETA